ncbi:MAG: Bro-N domain-containing protein, partial [Sideroxydans sp.]|nr:Bro-N domain-containing protein [Sideroxydans sp.]
WDEATQRWLFAVVDIVAALTESQNPQVYWRVLKKRLLAEGNETDTNCNGLKMTAPDGKQRLTDVADTEQLLRLIQSIPSPKAEPFKRWLAKVGYERLEEIENPELAAARMRGLYQAKGYSDEWIEKRVRGIAIRDELTNGHKSWLSLLKKLVMPVSLSSILSRERARKQTNRFATYTLLNGKNAV